MRIISVSPCRHFDCSNRNSFGYCKTTVCINEHYQQEQWGSPSTTNKSESVVQKPPAIRPMQLDGRNIIAGKLKDDAFEIVRLDNDSSDNTV